MHDCTYVLIIDLQVQL